MRSELVSLYLDAFPEDGERYAEYFVKKARKENIVIYADGGERITSVAYIVPKRAVINGKSIPISYLSAVSTISDLRGKGLIKKVIVPALERLSARNEPFVALYPFSHTYYLKFGFISVSQSGKALIDGKNKFFVRSANACDIDKMIEIYNDYARKFSFYQAVDELYFKELLDEVKVSRGEIVLIYDELERAQAYAVVEGNTVTKHAYRDRKFIDDCAYLSGKSYSDFTADKEPYIQMRIANLLEFLRLDIYEEGADFKVSVKDDLLKGNDGVYKIRKEHGRVSVLKLTSETNDSAISISELLERFIEGKLAFKKPTVMFMDKY